MADGFLALQPVQGSAASEGSRRLGVEPARSVGLAHARAVHPRAVLRRNRRRQVGQVQMRITVSFTLGLTLALGASSAAAQNRLTPDAPRPIAAGESLWAEELTFMDVREAVRGGTTTIIIGTGGVEQN